MEKCVNCEANMDSKIQVCLECNTVTKRSARHPSLKLVKTYPDVFLGLSGLVAISIIAYIIFQLVSS